MKVIRAHKVEAYDAQDRWWEDCTVEAYEMRAEPEDYAIGGGKVDVCATVCRCPRRPRRRTQSYGRGRGLMRIWRKFLVFIFGPPVCHACWVHNFNCIGYCRLTDAVRTSIYVEDYTP